MSKYLLAGLLLASRHMVNADQVNISVERIASPSIQWLNCGSDAPPTLECGSIQVPLDWANPTGQQINLNLSRVRATSNNLRVGSLFFNPGGPGGSATRRCREQALGNEAFDNTTAAHFDIICPDPRGVSQSTPVRCDHDLWNARQTLFPKDDISYQQMFNHYRAFGESCLNLTGDVVKFVDTVSVARDFEAIRVALGEGKLNYLGISYGTQIGTTYAELFPENIRAMAIDGILDHSASETYFLTAESETYENVLDQFFEWCTGNSTCVLHGQNVSQIFDSLVTQADRDPIPAPDCLPMENNSSFGPCYSNVTGEDIRLNAQGFLLRESNWHKLGQALSDASKGNATLLSSPLAVDDDSTLWQGLIVGCLDWRRNSGYEDNQYKQLLTASLSPHTKGASQSYTYEAQCAGWPVKITNPQETLNQTAMALTPPILMVNAYFDPSTSYVWANSVKEQVPNGVLLTRNGVGHTSYSLGGETTAAINAYLIDGALPAPGTVLQS